MVEPRIPKVKICGLTTLKDALQAARLGADGLGFLVGLSYYSEDQIDPEAAASIVSKLPPLVSSVLVTHQTELETVVRLCRKVKANTVQLHGNFPIAAIPALREQLPFVKMIKAIHVDGEGSIQLALDAAKNHVDAVLLDTKTKGRLGGTGQTHNWDISRQIRIALDSLKVPTVLAGGLNPENVRRAVVEVMPYGVDVNTGVSERRGVKALGLMERFMSEAKARVVLVEDETPSKLGLFR